MATSIKMTGIDKLSQAIQDHDKKVKRMIAGQFLRAQTEAPGFMKLNAPWTDRTANARAGLFAGVNFGPEQNFYAELILAGTVFYQIYLETRFSGRYAILMPATLHFGNLLMDRIASSINRIELQ